MNHFRIIALATFAGCIGIVLLPSLQANSQDKRTTLTINEPVQVPSCCTPDHNVTLQPGEYVMVLADSLADRYIVRIYDKGEQNVITTTLAVPNYRLRPSGKAELQYWEVPAGQPSALRAWFYPGDNFGREFVYSKQTAARIAAFVKTPIPAIDAQTVAVEDLGTVSLVAVDESGASSKLVTSIPEQTPNSALQPTLEVAPPTVSLQPQTADRTVQAVTPTPVKPELESLPQTASTMPLLGVTGLVSLALFAALELRRRHRRRYET